MSTIATTRDHRLAVRLTAWQKNTIERAATLEGGTITDFVVHATLDHAHDVLAEQPVYYVDQAAWDEFNRILDEPPLPVPAIADLLARPTVFDQ
ncbi:MAG: DUF1778 domain-containing protein [Propionibacteriaceae bacterium]|jgi:uncharacterized protein (DUF1778 family)|nr:DUF1778 domain-containing protein [Propionibacteriaceae bacterium]